VSWPYGEPISSIVVSIAGVNLDCQSWKRAVQAARGLSIALSSHFPDYCQGWQEKGCYKASGIYIEGVGSHLHQLQRGSRMLG
jgi:hypothetical protein